ncbi:DUF3558 domain-containing protein [Amycolatopsis echigonensis]|uniref:DUF3558 domain-containing protein n=1 Tax=Amycolatopsis echigonensis TaxID=2576905 RepID=A0A2N3WDS3_9PSEU|nr:MULTISPECIES: DUF3558 domain-containing protein [Amycolatopsis]MBB2500994.1 DUF3558 domain-containing protein [Amycolatopsis echigonensis]PKV92044.1 uncharacterized protein DUF3558 [Amycolatopsis niigatensis]
MATCTVLDVIRLSRAAESAKPALTATGSLLLLAVTGCSSATETPIQTAPESSSAPTSASRSVPKVSNPLDAAKYEQNPGALLSQAQATQLINAVRRRQGQGLVAPSCAWYDDRDNSVGLGLLPGQGGLGGAYTKGDSESGYFEVAPDLNGYPGVFAGTTDDRRCGGCQIAVGIKDDEVFTASVMLDKSFPGHHDPCALAAQTAAAAVTTLKAGA